MHRKTLTTIICVIQHFTTILNRRTLQFRALSCGQICSQQRAYRKFSTFTDSLTADQLILLTYSSADTTSHRSTGSQTTTNQRLGEGFVGCYLCRRPHEILLLVKTKISFRFDSKAATAKCKLKSDNLILKTITRGAINCIAVRVLYTHRTIHGKSEHKSYLCQSRLPRNAPF